MRRAVCLSIGYGIISLILAGLVWLVAELANAVGTHLVLGVSLSQLDVRNGPS